MQPQKNDAILTMVDLFVKKENRINGGVMVYGSRWDIKKEEVGTTLSMISNYSLDGSCCVP